MDGKYPSWNAHGGHSQVTPNSRKCQGTDDTNGASIHYGGSGTDQRYGENLNKGPDHMTDSLPFGDGSSYVHSALYTYSTDCHFTSPGTEAAPVQYSYFPVIQHPVRSDIEVVSEGCELRIEDNAKYNFVNDHLTSASVSVSHGLVPEKDQELESSNSSTWTSVIKEALEMSNGMGLEQDITAHTYRPPVVFKDHDTEMQRTNPGREPFNHVDYRRKVSEVDPRAEMHRAQDSSDTGSSDATNISPITSNQDVYHMKTVQMVTPLTHNTSVNVLLMGQIPENSSSGTSKGHAHSLEDVNPGKCMHGQSGEEFCFEASKASVPRNLPKPSNNLMLTQGPSQNNVDQTSHNECSWSGVKKTPATTEIQIQKSNVTHSESMLIHKENVTEASSIGNTDDIHPKQFEKSNIPPSVFDSTLVETSSKHSTTSVSKLEDLVNNLNKGIPMSPVKCTKTILDTANETIIVGKCCNLPSFPEKSLENTECTPTKEAAPIAVQTTMKNQKNTAQRMASDILSYHENSKTSYSTRITLGMECQESSESPTSENIPNTSKKQSCIQESSVEENIVSTSTSEAEDTEMDKELGSQVTESVLQKFKNQHHFTRNILKKIKECKSESSAKQVVNSDKQISCEISKSNNCKSFKSQVECENTEATHHSCKTSANNWYEKESLNEYDGNTTDALQCIKKKQKKPKKRNMVPEMKNSKAQVFQSSSVSPNKKLHLQKEQLLGMCNVTPNRNYIGDVTVTGNELFNTEEKIEMQNGTGNQNSLDNAILKNEHDILKSPLIKKQQSKLKDMPSFNRHRSPCELSSPRMETPSQSHISASNTSKKTKTQTKSPRKMDRKTKHHAVIDKDTFHFTPQSLGQTLTDSCDTETGDPSPDFSSENTAKKEHEIDKNINSQIVTENLSQMYENLINSTSNMKHHCSTSECHESHLIKNIKEVPPIVLSKNVPLAKDIQNKQKKQRSKRKITELKSPAVQAGNSGKQISCEISRSQSCGSIEIQLGCENTDHSFRLSPDNLKEKEGLNERDRLTTNVPQYPENQEEGVSTCEISKPPECISFSENTCLRKQSTTKKSKKIQQSKVKNKSGPSQPDELSLHAQSSDVSNTTDELNTIYSDDSITACNVPNTLKNPRRIKISTLKKDDEQSLEQNHIAQTNLSQELLKTTELQQKLQDFTIMTLEEHSGTQKAKGVKKRAKQSQMVPKSSVPAVSCSEMLPPKELKNVFSDISVIKTELVEVSVATKTEITDILKNTGQKDVSKRHLFRKNIDKSVKIEPVSKPEHFCKFSVNSCEKKSNKKGVSVNADSFIDHSSESKTVKSITCPAIKKTKGHHITKKTIMKMGSHFQTHQNTLENITAQKLQVSQIDSSRPFTKTNEKTEETETVSFMNTIRRSSRIQKNLSLSESLKTCSSVNLVSSECCDGPVKQEQSDTQATFSHCKGSSGCRRRKEKRRKKKKSTPTGENEMKATTFSDAVEKCDSLEQEMNADPCETTLMKKNVSEKSKENKSLLTIEHCIPPLQVLCDSPSGLGATNEVTTAPSSLKNRKIQPCRKSKIIKRAKSIVNSVSSLANMENLSQDVLTHGGKRNKGSEVQASNVNITSLRYSRRLSKVPPDYVKSVEKDDFSSFNSHDQTTSSQAVQQKNKKPEINKSANIQSKSEISEHLNSKNSYVFPGCQLTTEQTNKQATEDDLMVSGSFIDRKESKKEKKQLEKCIPRIKKRELISEMTVQDQAAKSQSAKTSRPSIRKVSSWKVLDHHGNSVRPETSKTDKLLDCFEDSLKTEKYNNDPDLTDAANCSAIDFLVASNTSKTRLKPDIRDVSFDIPTDLPIENKNCKLRDLTENTRKKNEKALSIDISGDCAFEMSIQSSVNGTESHSNKNGTTFCGKNLKDRRSMKPLSDADVTTPEKQVRVLGLFMPGTSGTIENDFSEANVVGEATSPPVQKVDGFSQYSDDLLETSNKGSCGATTTVKSVTRGCPPKGIGKKCITCKYCGRCFHYVSAYIIHLHAHTGEKHYKCKTCGKNFAHLSKLRSHRNVHMKPAGSLPCPCCNKRFSQKNNLISHFKTHLQEQKAKVKKYAKCWSDAFSASPLKSSKNKKSHICKICSNTFSSKFMLKTHMDMHGRENALSCSACGKQFKKPLHLVVHERTHWPVKPYACSICGKGFNKLKALKRHSLEHRGYTPFSCFHCGQAFCDLSALRMHQISKQCIVKNRLNEDSYNIEGFLVSQGVDGQVNLPVFFKCQICKQLCQKWCHYTLHLQTHTKSPPYLCFACGQSYEKDSSFSVHCKVCCQSSGEEVACVASLSEIMQSDTQNMHYPLNPHIDTDSIQTTESKTISLSTANQPQEKVQSTSNNINSVEGLASQPSHIEKSSSLQVTVPNSEQLPIHLYSNPASSAPSVMSRPSSNDSVGSIKNSPSTSRFECSCGQRYEKYRALCAHMQTHFLGFRYLCGHCGRSFEKWNRLWLHQRIHCTKGRGYFCSQCNVQFHFLGSYKEHMLKHSEDKTFACSLCPETFVHKEGLHVHHCEFHQMSKMLRCDVCSKSFSTLRNLVKHSLLHNGAISHQCLPCSFAFTNSKLFEKHLKTHHKALAVTLPDIPIEPLSFPHKCRRCKESFSTGDLLYAHQICHIKDSKKQVCPTHITESTSFVSEVEPQPYTETTLSTCRPLASMLNLGSVPDNVSLYMYPHPDNLYLIPSRSRKRFQIVINDVPPPPNTSSGSSNTRMSISDLAEQGILESAQEPLEIGTSQLPQTVESLEPACIPSQATECLLEPHTDAVSSNVRDIDNLNQPVTFVETSAVIEGLVPVEENNEQGTFECADCSEQLTSLAGLHEHYFLHALGNRYMDIKKMFH